MNSNYQPILSHSTFKCSTNIEKLRITIKLEQVSQYGVATNEKSANITTNLKIEKTFNWKEKIKKVLIPPIKNIQSSEPNSEDIIFKDIFYTITSPDKPNNEVELAFVNGNLGNHCQNSLTTLITPRNSINQTLNVDNGTKRITQEKLKQNNDTETMHIIFNISSIIVGDRLNDCDLVTLRYNKSLGELRMFPGPNDGQLGYRLAPKGLSPPFFLYWIHLIQQPNPVHPKSQRSVGLLVPSISFDRLIKGKLCLMLFCTISKFQFLDKNRDQRFYINYSIHLPKGWRNISEGDDQLSSTHTALGGDNGIFQHLINYTLVYNLKHGENITRWPTLVMGIVSGNGNYEIESEAFCSLTIPPRPGRYSYHLPVHTYRDTIKEPFSKLLTNSTSNISDDFFASNIAVNDGLQGRYGLVSEIIGNLDIELQSVLTKSSLI